jgi:hypothetical protein
MIPVYRSQYGRGIGGVLSGLMRQAVPFILPALKSVGKKALKAGGRALLARGVQALEGTASRPRKRRRAVKPKRVVKRRKRDALS